MIRTVLLPTDLSADSDRVMRFCTGLGALGVRRVVCAHVLDVTGLEGPVISGRLDAARAQMRSKVQPLVEAGFDVEVRIPTGDPGRELIALESEAHVDAIVLGTRGKSAADRFFVASVSDDLLRDASVPTLTVRYDLLSNSEDPALLGAAFARMLLVPTDFSASADRALSVALVLPPKAIGNVRVLHVIPREADPVRAGRTEAGADFQLRNIVAMAAEKGMHATAVIGHGEPVRAIITEIHESGVTGVVVGFRGRTVLGEALMGSVSMTLMRQASCPVMIVP
jgi:nucleotide-binding universal stress UspA family protein